MPTPTRLERRLADHAAAGVLAKNVDPIMALVAKSLAEVGPGQESLVPCVRESRLVFDIARRLDDAIPVPEPVESWDILAWVLVAGIALAIYRRAQKSSNPEASAARLVKQAAKAAAARLKVALD